MISFYVSGSKFLTILYDDVRPQKDIWSTDRRTCWFRSTW